MWKEVFLNDKALQQVWRLRPWGCAGKTVPRAGREGEATVGARGDFRRDRRSALCHLLECSFPGGRSKDFRPVQESLGKSEDMGYWQMFPGRPRREAYGGVDLRAPGLLR